MCMRHNQHSKPPGPRSSACIGSPVKWALIPKSCRLLILHSGDPSREGFAQRSRAKRETTLVISVKQVPDSVLSNQSLPETQGFSGWHGVGGWALSEKSHEEFLTSQLVTLCLLKTWSPLDQWMVELSWRPCYGLMCLIHKSGSLGKSRKRARWVGMTLILLTNVTVISGWYSKIP